MNSSIDLYNALADDYAGGFYDVPHRAAYDQLAWEIVSAHLPPAPGLVVDAGCGTGHWVTRLLDAGHRVLGIEQAPRMIDALRRSVRDPRFSLVAQDYETATLAPATADIVLAMGSLQYARDPLQGLVRFASWLKPGGWCCVLVDSRAALTVELLQRNQMDEALTRLETGWGRWESHGQAADLHLLDRATLEDWFRQAGFPAPQCRGLLITASIWGRDRLTENLLRDQEAVYALERRLGQHLLMADLGKQLLVFGTKEE